MNKGDFYNENGEYLFTDKFNDWTNIENRKKQTAFYTSKSLHDKIMEL